MKKKAREMLEALHAKGVSIQISRISWDGKSQDTIGDSNKYPIASLYKFSLLLKTICEQPDTFWEVEARITPFDQAIGYGILRGLPHPVTLTLGNLAYMLLFNSDGTAAETLFNSESLSSFVKLPFSLGEQTLLTKHHADMVEYANREFTKISLIPDQSSRNVALKELVSTPENLGGFTEASDYVKVLRTDASVAHEKSNFFRRMTEEGPKRPLRSARRMFGGLPKGLHAIGKTGTLGFGYVLNDSGIIFQNGSPKEIVAVTSYGWTNAVEESELAISNIAESFLFL